MMPSSPQLDPARWPELYEAVCQLYGSPELDQVLERVMPVAIKLVGAERAFIKLHDEQVVRAIPASAADNRPVTASIMILADDVAKNRRSDLIVNGRDDPRFPAELLATVFADRTILTVPLQIQREFFGTLVVDRSVTISPFTPDDMAVLNCFAASAMLAIQSASVTRERRDFTYTLIHELRAPVGLIIGYAELMMLEDQGPLNDEQKQSMVAIHRAGRTIGRLLSEWLEDQKAISGRSRLDIQSVDLRSCIEEIMIEQPLKDFQRSLIDAGVKPEDISASLAYQARAKQQTITLNLPALPLVRTDRDELMYIVTEWLRDAIRYAEENSDINLFAEIQDKVVKVSIQDLRRYGHRCPFARKVKLMGGTIGFESQPGKGSTFWFTLPIAEQDTSNNPR